MKKQVRLSSKGQIVLPKPIRDALGLEEGDLLEAEVSGGVINLHPRDLDTIMDHLRGRFSGDGLVLELVEDHRRDTEREKNAYS